MKILELSAHGGFGGGERVMFDVVSGLEGRFQFIVMAPKGEFLKKFDELDADVLVIKSSGLMRIVKEIRKVIKDQNPDVIHCHGTRAATWGRLAMIGLRTQTKLIYTVHGFHLAKRQGLKKPLVILFERFLNRWSDTVISVSEADKEVMINERVANKVEVIRNGVDLSRFEMNQTKILDLKRELGIQNEFVITSVARLHPQKDIATLLKAFALLQKNNDRRESETVLLLVGDGELRVELQDLSDQLELSKNVRFLGSRSDVPEMILASDAVVLSTNWEGFPLVPLEAGAARKPIIGTDVPGVRETIIDGQTGLLVQHGSVSDLAEKIQKLIDSRETCIRLGQNGYRYVSESLSKEIMVANHSKLYDRFSDDHKKSLQIVKLYAPVIGGVEKIAQQVAEGIGSDVLCCRKKGAREVEEVNEVKVTRSASFGMFKAMPVSFDFINQWRKVRGGYDVVDFHAPFPLGDLAMMMFRPKGKLIVHYHSDIVRQKFLGALLKPLLMSTLRRADKIIVSSPNLKESSMPLKKFQDKVEVVPFGLDLDEYSKFDDEHVAELKNRYGKFALYVGRFGYYKGLTYLVEAMRNVDHKLVMIGDGPERFKIEKLIVEHGLQDKIILLPFQDDDKLKDYFHAASVFVLPSIFRSEAFGIVLLEALACRTPLISTELGTGTSWVNQDTHTGIVVRPRDAEQLAGAINRVLCKDSLREQYSDKALRRAQDVFDEKLMLEKTQEIYKM